MTELEGFLPWELSALWPSHRESQGWWAGVGIRLVPGVHLSRSQDHPWNSKDTEMTRKTLKRSQGHKALGKTKGLHQERLSAVAPSPQVHPGEPGALTLPFPLAKTAEGKGPGQGRVKRREMA